MLITSAAALSHQDPIRAQTLEPVQVFAEPLQYSKSGEFRGCGLNLRLIRQAGDSQFDHLTLSVNFFLDGQTAMTKVALSKVTSGKVPKVSRVPIHSTWTRMKPQDTLPALSTFQGEDQAVLTNAPLEPALELALAALAGDHDLQVGFKRSGQDFESVFYGRPTIEREAAMQVITCLEELLERQRSQLVQGETK